MFDLAAINNFSIPKLQREITGAAAQNKKSYDELREALAQIRLLALDVDGYLTALVLSVLWNFTLNREFTFKSANNIPLAMVKVAAFYCVFTPLSTWWGARLTDAGWNEYIVLFGTMAVNLTTEFLYDRFFVFRGSLNTNKRAKREGKEKNNG